MHNIIMSVAVWGHNESNLGISKPGGCQWLKTQHNYRQQAQSRAEKSLCCKSRSGIVPRFSSQSNPSGHLKHHGATSYQEVLFQCVSLHQFFLLLVFSSTFCNAQKFYQVLKKATPLSETRCNDLLWNRILIYLLST